MASFRFVETGEQIYTGDLPLTYKHFTMMHMKHLVNSPDYQQGLLPADCAQAFFFSGQIEKYFNWKLVNDSRCFVDLVHLGNQLWQLDEIATKFGLTSRLYGKNKTHLTSQMEQKDLMATYRGEHDRFPCIDLVALSAQYLNMMRDTGDVNTITDAICLTELMQDGEVARACLALYCINNQNAIDTVLELDGVQ